MSHQLRTVHQEIRQDIEQLRDDFQRRLDVEGRAGSWDDTENPLSNPDITCRRRRRLLTKPKYEPKDPNVSLVKVRIIWQMME